MVRGPDARVALVQMLHSESSDANKSVHIREMVYALCLCCPRSPKRSQLRSVVD